MHYINQTLIIIVTFTFFLKAQDYTTSLELENNYNGWGWDSVYVINNGLIKTSIFPSVGGRVLEYNLAEHPSMYVNENRYGFMFEDGNPYSIGGGIGGYKVWPAPQDNWGWPPPPILAWGPYSHEILINSSDSVSVYLTGMEETTKAPGIRFERRFTFYKNSSRVKVDQVIINENSTARNWSVWDVTQSLTRHGNETDYQNFWVYFPINPQSHYGSNGVSTSDFSAAWRGEVAPGIYGVEFKPENKKIFADPHIGWICYVDERDSIAFAKTFDVSEEESYPDDEARIAVWINGNPSYLEVEVMSPIKNLAGNGGRYTFTEEWWAAKVNGPILNVNSTGAIAQHAFTDLTATYGSYGVFHVGTAYLEFKNSADETIQIGQSFTVSPLHIFNLMDTTDIPGSAVKANLVVIDSSGNQIGILDTISFIVSDIAGNSVHVPGRITLAQNYPNPFNPQTTINYQVKTSSTTVPIELSIYNIMGQKVATLINKRQSAGEYSVIFNSGNLPSGVYIYRLTAGNYSQSLKMIILK
jgi:hypothetical protein